MATKAGKAIVIGGALALISGLIYAGTRRGEVAPPTAPPRNATVSLENVSDDPSFPHSTHWRLLVGYGFADAQVADWTPIGTPITFDLDAVREKLTGRGWAVKTQEVPLEGPFRIEVDLYPGIKTNGGTSFRAKSTTYSFSAGRVAVFYWDNAMMLPAYVTH